MTDGSPTNRLSISRLILVPAIITLAVTILRLVGELQHWPSLLFNNSAGGGGAIIGISWLPIFFGPYFAVRLIRTGDRPSGIGKTIGFAVLGFVLMGAGGTLAFAVPKDFPGKIFLGLLLVAVGGAIQFPAWSSLAKTLLAYAYAARIPVAIVMYLAMRGSWGTHYDALPPTYAGPTDFWGKYAFLGLAPQLLLWIVYTMTLGALLGGITAVILKKPKSQPESSS